MELKRTQLAGIGCTSLVLAAALGYGVGVLTSKPQAIEADAADISQPKPPSEPALSSKIIEKVNPLDDSKNYTYVIQADNEGTDMIGSTKSASLIVRCKSSEKDVFINPPEFLSSSDRHRIILRWDDTFKENKWWSPAEGGGAAFSEEPMILLSKMIKHDKLVVGYQPYNKTQNAAVFDLKDARADLVKMQSYCN